MVSNRIRPVSVQISYVGLVRKPGLFGLGDCGQRGQDQTWSVHSSRRNRFARKSDCRPIVFTATSPPSPQLLPRLDRQPAFRPIGRILQVLAQGGFQPASSVAHCSCWVPSINPYSAKQVTAPYGAPSSPASDPVRRCARAARGLRGSRRAKNARRTRSRHRDR